MATTSNPGKGYIILKPGTVIEDGDEYYSRQDASWIHTADQGRIIKYSCDLTYRRKKVVKSRLNISTLTADNKRLRAENKILQDQISNILDILYNKYGNGKDNRR